MHSLFRKCWISIGIDIGEKSIKLIKLQKINNKLCLIDYKIFNNHNVFNALKAMTSAEKINGNIVTALRYNSILTKVISLDSSLSLYEIWKYFRINAEKYFGLSSQNLCMDFEILNNIDNQNNKKMDIQLVAAKQSFIDEKLTLLKKTNLKVKALDIEHFALARAALLQSKLSKDELLIIINCKEDYLLFCAIKNKNIIYTNEINITENESITLLIISELQLFLTTHNFLITSLILSGDDTIKQINLLDIKNFFKTKTLINIASPFNGINISEKIDRQILNAIAPSLMISFGLALRQFSYD